MASSVFTFLTPISSVFLPSFVSVPLSIHSTTSAAKLPMTAAVPFSSFLSVPSCPPFHSVPLTSPLPAASQHMACTTTCHGYLKPLQAQIYMASHFKLSKLTLYICWFRISNSCKKYLSGSATTGAHLWLPRKSCFWLSLYWGLAAQPLGGSL